MGFNPIPETPTGLAGTAVLADLGAPTRADAPRVLVIDPQPDLEECAAIQMLRQGGLAIDRAGKADEALAALEEGLHRLVILEIAAGEYDGFDLCRRAAARGLPLLIWSVRAEPLDQVAGFELGADDYVSKRAHPLEFLARVRALLRRSVYPPPAGEGPAAEARSWRLDDANGLFEGQGGRVWLTSACAAVLHALARHPRELVERSELAMELYGSLDRIPSRAIDTRVARLRSALEACGGDNLIHSVRGAGYVLEADVSHADHTTVIRG